MSVVSAFRKSFHSSWCGLGLSACLWVHVSCWERMFRDYSSVSFVWGLWIVEFLLFYHFEFIFRVFLLSFVFCQRHSYSWSCFAFLLGVVRSIASFSLLYWCRLLVVGSLVVLCANSSIESDIWVAAHCGSQYFTLVFYLFTLLFINVSWFFTCLELPLVCLLVWLYFSECCSNILFRIKVLADELCPGLGRLPLPFPRTRH